MLSSLFPATRWTLLRNCVDDPDAVHVIIEQYLEGITRYLHIRMDYAVQKGVIDDVVNEVVLTLLQRPQIISAVAPEEGKRFRYFIMTVAHNLARNAFRRLDGGMRIQLGDHQVEEAIAFGRSALQDPIDEAISMMDRAWAMGVLSQAWQDLGGIVEAGKLDESALELLRKHILEGRGMRDLAGEYGIGLATCQRRVAAAKHHLQKLLRQRLGAVGESPPEGVDVCAELLHALSVPWPQLKDE